MKTFSEYLDKIGYSWNDFDRTYEMENLIEQYAEERIKQALIAKQTQKELIKEIMETDEELGLYDIEENKDLTSNDAKPMLCDGFLIPMTDFVNNVGNMENYPSHEKALSWIYNYAIFLKQPLKLEMFVPCDEGGNVFEKPSDEELEKFKGLEYGSFDCNYTYIFDYNLAKEKVLFEHKLQFDLGVIRHHISQGRNIEYLANFGSIKLTQNSLNAIFG